MSDRFIRLSYSLLYKHDGVVMVKGRDHDIKTTVKKFTG